MRVALHEWMMVACIIPHIERMKYFCLELSLKVQSIILIQESDFRKLITDFWVTHTHTHTHTHKHNSITGVT